MLPFKEIPRYPADFDITGKPIPAEERPAGIPTVETSIFMNEVSMDVAHHLARYLSANTSRERRQRLAEIHEFSNTSNKNLYALYTTAHDLLLSVPPNSEVRKRFQSFFSHFSPAQSLIFFDEREARDENPVSASSARDVMHWVGIPEESNITGLAILDIGAGASELTAELLTRGAHAFAVDPMYINQPALFASLNHLPRNQWRARERFKQSITEHPEHYIAGSALGIPFQSDSFDLVVSNVSLLGYLDHDYSVLHDAIDEALRVTKKKGKITLFPFNYRFENTPEEDERLANNNNMLHELRNRPDVTAYAEPIDPTDSRNSLVIIKK